MSLPDFSLASIIAGLVFGVLGLSIFRQGKKTLNYTWLFIGAALMTFQLFTENIWQDLGIGTLLLVGAYFSR